VSPVLTDDWWATSEGLVEVAESAAGVELAPKARLALVEMTVELLVLLTCWPGTAHPADALGYLRTRRARMVAHAPWLYALPPSVRRLLVGTDCLPSLLTFVVGGRQLDEALRRAWRQALGALASHVEAADRPAPELGASPTEHGAPDAAPYSSLRPLSRTRRGRHHGPCRVRPRRSGREEVQDMGLAPLALAGAAGLPVGALPGIGVPVGSLEGPVPPVGAGQLPVATQPCAPVGQLPSLGGPGRGCRGNPGHGDEGRRRAGRGLAGHAARGSCPGRARPWPRRRPQLRGQLAALGRDGARCAGRGGGWRLRPGSSRRPCRPALELRAPPGYAVPQVSPAPAVAGDRVLTPGTFPGPPGPGRPGHVGIYLSYGLVPSALDPQDGVVVQTWPAFMSGGLDAVVVPASEQWARRISPPRTLLREKPRPSGRPRRNNPRDHHTERQRAARDQ
jgi:hypothetical protein